MIYIDEVDVDNNICYFGCSCIGLCMAEPFVRSTTIDVSGSTKYSMYLICTCHLHLILANTSCAERPVCCLKLLHARIDASVPV